MNIIIAIADIKIRKYFQQIYAIILKLILNYIYLKNDLTMTQEVIENLKEHRFLQLNL